VARYAKTPRVSFNGMQGSLSSKMASATS
jgi:hypothetical protein